MSHVKLLKWGRNMTSQMSFLSQTKVRKTVVNFKMTFNLSFTRDTSPEWKSCACFWLQSQEFAAWQEMQLSVVMSGLNNGPIWSFFWVKTGSTWWSDENIMYLTKKMLSVGPLASWYSRTNYWTGFSFLQKRRWHHDTMFSPWCFVLMFDFWPYL